MSKASPLLGYNTNVRHKGKVYHIQTEDSGIQHPHIITHLFADGGRIVASRKTSYQEQVGTADYPGAVKKMMQEQHKAMFIALRDGQFDDAEALFTQAMAGKPAAAPTSSTAPTTPGAVPAPIHAAATPIANKKPSSPPKSIPSKSPPAPPPKRSASKSSMPSPVAQGDDAFERAAADRVRESQIGNAPAPASRYQTTQPTKSSARAKRPSTPPEPPPSIFGSDLLSEKSLDEVILSYLAEDLEEK